MYHMLCHCPHDLITLHYNILECDLAVTRLSVDVMTEHDILANTHTTGALGLYQKDQGMVSDNMK